MSTFSKLLADDKIFDDVQNIARIDARSRVHSKEPDCMIWEWK